MTRSQPLVIIGGGPAGVAAAIEAAHAGLSATLIDEAPHLGGQIYRKPSHSFKVADAGALGKDFIRGEQLRAEVAEVTDQVKVLWLEALGYGQGSQQGQCHHCPQPLRLLKYTTGWPMGRSPFWLPWHAHALELTIFGPLPATFNTNPK